MAKKLRIPLPVQWHEGLLLYPQHFQQQRRVHQDAIAATLHTTQPFFWGVRTCVLDTKALATGIIKIQEMQALMPDGTLVEVTPESPVAFSLSGMEKSLLGSKKIIHLCLPEEHDGAANARDDLPRYKEICRPEHHHVDENTGENSVAIPRLQPLVSLMVGSVPARYISMPLCEVTFNEGVFALTPFCPPTCILEKKGPIANMFSEHLDTLHDRITYFVERLQSPLGYEASALIEKYRHLYSHPVRPFFILNALAKQEETHPYTLFLELCRACGDFAAVVPGRMPVSIDPYNHNDPRGSLEKVLGVFQEYVLMIEKPSLNVPFHVEDDIFYLHLSKEWCSTPLTLSVHPDKQQDIDSVISWIEGALIISKSLVPQSQSKRVLGAKRAFVEQDEELGLVQSAHRILVHVDVEESSIKPNEELCIVHLSKAHKAPKSICLCIKEDKTKE